MRRKTRCGYVHIEEQTWRQRRGIDFEPPSESVGKISVGEITKKLDELIVMRKSLAKIESDEHFAIAFDEFIEVQSSIIETVAPVLDRLASVGALLLEYIQEDSGLEESKSLNLWSESGYQIVRGYRIFGTKLDTISDPPPDLISDLDGDEGFFQGSKESV